MWGFPGAAENKGPLRVSLQGWGRGGKGRGLLFIPNLWSGEGNGIPLQYSCLENPMDGGAWCAAVYRVANSQTRLSVFTFTFHFHALEKEMATHSSVLAWRIPGMGEPGGLPSMGSHRVEHDWSNWAAAAGNLYIWWFWIRNYILLKLTCGMPCILFQKIFALGSVGSKRWLWTYHTTAFILFE